MTEIAEQPDVWERLAGGDTAARLARSLGGDVLFVGSGSSLNVATLGALALRRRGRNAQALAATEARLDNRAYRNRTVVAVSQSGASSDVLAALDVLEPRAIVALTNSPASPLAARATTVIDIAAGPERAVPASKSVSASVALVLWAASLVAGDGRRDADGLARTARDVRSWLDSDALGTVVDAAHHIAERPSVAILGTDYGFPIAREAGLKLKEAAYLHAEGFAAGEFRHGSVAMIDPSFSVIGVVDDDGSVIVERPLREIEHAGALRYTVGSRALAGIARLGPDVDVPFNTLAWLVTIQLLALHAARARGIDSDTPRGLVKAIVSPATKGAAESPAKRPS